MHHGAQHLTRFGEAGRGQPLMQGKRMAGGVDEGAAVDEAQCAIHAQP